MLIVTALLRAFQQWWGTMSDAGLAAKLERIQGAIERQKTFVRTVPDPDNRALAESNLMTLVIMRDDVREVIEQGSHSFDVRGIEVR